MRFATTVLLVLSVACSHADQSFERDMTDKNVVVTGGAQGIGREISNSFLKNGAKMVAIVDYQKEKGEATVKELNEKYGEGKAIFYYADVTKNLDEVDREFTEMYGHPDVLVNNAGVMREDDATLTIETNLLATIQWSMRMYEVTRKDKGGIGSTIINIADEYSYMTDAFLPFYKAAAHGILGFTETMGHEYIYRDSGVRMITVCPSFTYTEMTSGQMTTDEYADVFAKYAEEFTWQTAEAVGDAIIEIFKVAESGSTYTIVGGEIHESPEYVKVSASEIDSIVAEHS